MAARRKFDSSLAFVPMATASPVELRVCLKHRYAMAFNDMFLALKVCHSAFYTDI
jgi:hypothetical protein